MVCLATSIPYGQIVSLAGKTAGRHRIWQLAHGRAARLLPDFLAGFAVAAEQV